ncbi:MAG: HD domain-containing protein [Myxococcales bacterium]|nr:HD domain-containing protein [Myxococcales bacterium]
MTHEERARFAEALRFALEAHGDQKRKGTRIPYVSHLVQVAGLVLEHGGDVEQAMAGLLHDVIEDCGPVDDSTLTECFGPEVTRIVRSCTDVLEGDTSDKKSDWLTRKQRYIEHLRGADARVKLVAACDKLDNLRSLVADLHAEGPSTLERFRGTPAQTRWYYDEVRQALGTELPQRLLFEVDALNDEFRRLVPEPADVETMP